MTSSDNTTPPTQTTVKPDEQQGLDIQGYIKIHDPESGNVSHLVNRHLTTLPQ